MGYGMADNKENIEQEENDLKQSANLMADTTETAAKAGKNIADKKRERAAENSGDKKQEHTGENPAEKKQERTADKQNNSSGLKSTGTSEKPSDQNNHLSGSPSSPQENRREDHNRKAVPKDTAGLQQNGNLKPQQIHQGKEGQKLASSVSKNAGKMTGKAAGSAVKKGAKKLLNSVRDMLRKLMIFLGPYLLVIFFVVFVIVILVFVAYSIAYRFRNTSSGGSGNYSYNWVTKETGSLDEEEKQNNVVIIYGELKNEGWSLNAIAAAIGNWDWESGLNPGRWQNDDIGNTSVGYGLAQWTPATKILNWLSDNGYEQDSGEGQLQWVIQNTKTDWNASNNAEKMTADTFLNSDKDAATLALYYCQSFERGTWTEVRAEYATKWYNWLKDNGDAALAKLKTSSHGTYNITITDIQNCTSKQEYLDVVMPCYSDYCKEFGIKYPGILALQVYYEVGSGFPQTLSNVAQKDNNLGGLKYGSGGIPGSSPGSSIPSNEGTGTYCHFDSIGDYYYAQCWQVGQPLYANVRNHQDSMEDFARTLCNLWIGGKTGSGAYGYSESLISDYKKYNLSKWEG